MRTFPARPLPLFSLAAFAFAALALPAALLPPAAALGAERPNIVLVMADDQGWGQMGYYDHPVLKTPNFDQMAAAGLRFDRFYAGAPNCSPTRATVLTGRSNDRTGVHNHGFALRLQERTLPAALAAAGYQTAHFGKWHLNGFSGPGAPVLVEDDHNPGAFGFQEWISATNFFDRNPILGRAGKESRFEEFEGDSSEVAVAAALRYLQERREKAPFFVVVWFGSPHSPFVAGEDDKSGLPADCSRDHYGELVAMDRALGALRAGLRELQAAENTLLWYCSDNGGLPNVKPGSVGELRGFKNSMYEGGLRVPAILEWPGRVAPRVTRHPACTMDIFPTIAELLELPGEALLEPLDGVSLVPLLEKEIGPRREPIPFRHTGRGAMVDNEYKLVVPKVAGERYELYHLGEDPAESHDLSAERVEVAARMRRAFEEWNASVEGSRAGKDYPEGRVTHEVQPQRRWPGHPLYAKYRAAWRERPEYRGLLRNQD